MSETPPPAGPDWDYPNLSDRPPGRLLMLLRRHVAGIDHVESEIQTYAAQWHALNLDALAGDEPLWVVLGDSISQGVGATSTERGWVLTAARVLRERGVAHRIVNLSVSGARTADVVERQLPALRGLSTRPAAVSVLIGSNDMLRHEHRAALPEQYRALVAALPRHALVAVAAHAFGPLAQAKQEVRAAALRGHVEAVPVRFGVRNHAADHFHPNDLGHQLLADDFVTALHTRLTTAVEPM